MRTEELRRIILRTFGSRKFYGYELHRELASENIAIGMSRLYRILTLMLEEGLLEGEWEKSLNGPKKRIYRLGKKGREERGKILLNAIETVHSFYGEYLFNLPAKLNVFNKVSKLMSAGLNGKASIACVINEYSPVVEKVLDGLHNQVPQAKIYLVKPNPTKEEAGIGDRLFLEGDCDSIPLKDDFVDVVNVIGVPRRDQLEASLKEFHRVLKQNGTLVIATPTVFVHKYDEPLAIGNFMEKFEHRMQGNEYVDGVMLSALLKKLFHKVQEKSIVHLTIFLASEPVLH